MEHLHFNGLPQNIHQCSSRRDGDWIIWNCPHCPGYERKFNWMTGEMRVRKGDPDARHVGIADHSEPSDSLPVQICLN